MKTLTAYKPKHPPVNCGIWQRVKKFALPALILAIFSSALTACGSVAAGEPAFTTAQGPADAALPHHAVLAINKNSDERLISAAQNFCLRITEFSRGGAIFSLSLSENALHDLQTGKADAILLEGADVDAFSPVSGAFRYKSYEHFSMTVNSDSTLGILSDILNANVFAGFYAGSNVLLSHGSLDSKFKPLPRKDAEELRDSQSIHVSALSDDAARAFSLLKTYAAIEKELDARIKACALPGSIVEFSHSELNSPALLEALLSSASASSSDASGGSESESTEPDGQSEPFVFTRAFTGIKSVWLVFAETSYGRLSQTNRAAVAEASAYMVSDIDGVYLKHERETVESLTAEDVIISYDFTTTRIQVLRYSDEQDANLTPTQRKLKEAISKIQ